MKLQKDFKELLEWFNARGVEYLVVGGYALAFHGAPRATGGMDLFIRPDPDNARRVVASLRDFGFSSSSLSKEDFEVSDRITQIGVPPIRVDLITGIDGVTWQEAWAGKTPGAYGDVPVNFIGRAQFVANKRAAGRIKDLADIEALGEREPPPKKRRR